MVRFVKFLCTSPFPALRSGQVRSGQVARCTRVQPIQGAGQNQKKKRGTCVRHRPHIATHIHSHVYRVRGRHISTNCTKSSMHCIQAKKFLAVSFHVPKPRQRQYALSLSSHDCCNRPWAFWCPKSGIQFKTRQIHRSCGKRTTYAANFQYCLSAVVAPHKPVAPTHSRGAKFRAMADPKKC